MRGKKKLNFVIVALHRREVSGHEPRIYIFSRRRDSTIKKKYSELHNSTRTVL